MKKVYSAVLVFCLATFLLFTSVSTVPAAEAGPYYIGIFGGLAMPDDLNIDPPDRDVKLKNSWALGAKAGYIFPQCKWLATELEYFYLAKQDTDEPSIDDGDYSANNLMANLLVRYPEGRIHPYAGLGIGWSWGEVSGVFADDTSDNAFAWQILAGVNFEIAPKWSADLAYRYFRTVYKMGAEGFNADVTAPNHMILVGINYHF